MNANEWAERLASLLTEIELDGHEVYTVGSSVVVDKVKAVAPCFEGDPWTVELPTPPDPRYRVTAEAPERYFRSSTGVLHLRGSMVGGGLSESFSRCGLTFDLGRQAIPLRVTESARVCKRCHGSEG